MMDFGILPCVHLLRSVMSSQLQFRISYSEVEDRLFFYGTFADQKELKVILTRRLTLGFLGLAEKFSDHTTPVQDPVSKSQVVEFERDAASQAADRTKPYKGGEPHHELGGDPVLCNRISINPAGEDRVTLNIGLVTGKQVSFPLARKTFYAVWDMIAEIVRDRTEWAKAADLPTARSVPNQSTVLH